MEGISSVKSIDIQPDFDIVKCNICGRMFDEAHIAHFLGFGWRRQTWFHWVTYREIYLF